MKTGIVVYSGDAEAVWNAFRFGNFALASGDEVRVFLLGKGVEMESLDTELFKISDQVETFTGGGGKIFACGVCLDIHGVKPSGRYTVSSMRDLHDIVRWGDKVISF